jgi:predicted nucleotidyltransferase
MNKVRDLSDLQVPLQKLYPKLKQKYGIVKLGIFGSYVRNEQQEGSDLDLLVTFEETPGLFQYIELENFISDALGIKVDLVMEDALKPTIKERVLSEVLLI